MKKDSNSLESLHCHTRTSDGTLNYGQILDAGQKYNVGIVAFTDHDALPNDKDLEDLERLKDHPVKFLVGIELSVSHLAELKERIPLFHLVGLFVDPGNRQLQSYCRSRQEERLSRVKSIISNLRRVGFLISVEEVLSFAGGPSIGRPHIAEVLLNKDENRVLLAKMVDTESRKRDADFEKSLKIASEKEQLFRLLLGESALVPDVYVSYDDSLQMDDAVSLIRQAGGLAILAHWTFSKEVLKRGLVLRIAREHRIDGVEVAYGVNVDERLPEIRNDIRILEEIAKKTGLLRSGGGDIHNEADLKAFGTSDLAKGTQGMVEKIIKEAQPNLKWSSLK